MTDGERSIEDQEMITVSSNKDALDAQQICIEAKEMALQAQAQLDQKKEPVEVLADLNLLLNTHYREINQFIASDAAMKSEFYKIVFKQTADKLLQEKQLSQQGVSG